VVTHTLWGESWSHSELQFPWGQQVRAEGVGRWPHTGLAISQAQVQACSWILSSSKAWESQICPGRQGGQISCVPPGGLTKLSWAGASPTCAGDRRLGTIAITLPSILAQGQTCLLLSVSERSEKRRVTVTWRCLQGQKSQRQGRPRSCMGGGPCLAGQEGRDGQPRWTSSL
jgi:hypothetical protein